MPDIQIDASQLTIPYFTIPEGGTEVLDGSTSPPPRVSLPARTGYHLQPLNLAARFEFEVKADGTVDFDPAFDEFLNGRGTGTLVLCGYAISIDGTALSHDLLLTAEGKTWWPRGQTHQLTLMPAANYGFQSGSGIVGNWLFDVKPDGNVDYNPEFDEFLDGRGSSRLTVLGRLVDVDGIALSHDLIPMNLAGNAGPLPRSQVHRLTLMPAANYGFQPGSGIVGNWLFDVKPDGKVDYKPEFDQFLNGRDTQTLVLRGYAVSIDATHADSDLVGIANLEVSAQSPRGLSAVLLPAKGYLPRTANGIFATAFNLEPDGTISFSPSAAGRYVFKLSTSPNPSKLGEKVTLTASVHPVPPRQGTPQGSLTFKEGPTVLGYAELDQNGQATFQTSALSSGLHEIVIEYPGDQRFQPSSAELRHRVDPTGEPITDALPESPPPAQSAPLLVATRFAGDPILEQCAAGMHRMHDPEKGSAVEKVQQALLALGLPLPLHGADGWFGPETGNAVSQFKAANGIAPSDPVVGKGTMLTLDAKFAGEVRPIARWFVNTSRTRARDGNEAKAFITGEEAFQEIASAIRSTSGPDHFVCIAGWSCQLGFELVPGDTGSTIDGLLKEASDRGVAIRALLDHRAAGGGSGMGGGSGAFGDFNVFAVDFINGLPTGRAIHDDRHVPIGTHHQKIIIVYGGEGLVAFSGGMDLAPDRLKRPSPDVLHLHDVHCRYRGHVAEDHYRSFKERWSDHPSSAGTSLKSVAPSFTAVADKQAQAATTYPNGTRGIAGAPGGYGFATTGDRSARSLLHHAIATAQRCIYVEDQYLVDMATSQALLAALPRLASLVILIPDTNAVNSEIRQGWRRRREFLDPLLSAAPNKVSVCAHRRSTVHSKTWIFDDEFAIVGSVNCNRRGMTHDSEIVVGVYDALVHFNWAKQLRMALWGKHLHLASASLKDPIAAAVHWANPPTTADVFRYNPLAGTDEPVPEPDFIWNKVIDPDGS